MGVKSAKKKTNQISRVQYQSKDIDAVLSNIPRQAPSLDGFEQDVSRLKGASMFMGIVQAVKVALFGSQLACLFRPWALMFMGTLQAFQAATLSCVCTRALLLWAVVLMRILQASQAASSSSSRACAAIPWASSLVFILQAIKAATFSCKRACAFVPPAPSCPGSRSHI